MRIFALCLFLICCFLNLGCLRRLNKIYEYQTAKDKYDWGEVRANLLGSYQSGKKETIKGSPYELLITFESYTKVEGGVTVTAIELRNTNNQQVVFKKDDRLEKKFKMDSDGDYCARFLIKKLDLEYTGYLLILKFKIEINGSVIEREIKLDFKENYREYRSNDFWDRLMSA